MNIGANHFSKTQRKNLARKGITIVGIVYIPCADGDMPCAQGETGYQLNDNGCMRIRTYAEVVQLAA